MANTGIVGIEDSQDASLKEQSNSTHHILLADDDLYIRELYASALIRSGFQIDTVADGAAAWKMLCDNDFYTVLITDQVMPKLTGLELIEKLRFSKSKLPIILMSATMPLEHLKRHPEL
jgi:DNA-binding response OmpR family regulator